MLNISPECAPFAKKGGLGDVVGSLPKSLQKLGVDARVLMPAWPGVLDFARKHAKLSRAPLGTVSAAIDWRAWTANVWEAKLDRLRVYMLEQPELFSNTDIYPEVMSPENIRPFVFLSFAALELPSVVNWKPQILHAHDWPSAIAAPALRWHRYYSKFNGDYDTVFTIHNIAHQGLLTMAGLDGWGFDESAFASIDTTSMEFYGQLNLMKGALTSSEAITTVSPSYSWDIQTHDGGFGLDGVISANKSKLHGIINGIDYDVWNPAKDKLLPRCYSVGHMGGKADCRTALLHKCGWRDDGRPVVIFVGRLTEQKGVDIMLDALSKFVPEHIRAVIIGSGNEMYNNRVKDFAANNKDSVYSVTEFNEPMAHLAYAGGDILLMPSLFEPCGLSQLIAFAYGTVPVVRATGGLADTVFDADDSSDGAGFLFKEYSIDELARAMNRALDAKNDKERWVHIVSNGMKADYSWDRSAKEYANVYRAIITA